MVAQIRELSTGSNQWIAENDFKNGVALCQSIPGATAIQTAAYVGLKVRGISGALAAYIGFGLPAFIFMLLLSVLYARFSNLSKFISLFNGLQVIVVAIIFNATFLFGKGIANNYKNILIALLAALSLWFGVSPFVVIIVAGILGMTLLKVSASSNIVNSETKETPWNAKQIISLLVTFLICFMGLYLLSDILFNLAVAMLKIDLFAFGGGFASLPLMLHEIVNNRGWLDSKTFMDGIFASFVGLLLYVCIKFTIVVLWDIVRILLCLATLTALLRKVNILYIVPIGAVISAFLL